MGSRVYPIPPLISDPSPNWSEPEWAHRLQHHIPALTRKVTLPPYGVEWEDFLQEVRQILIVRSHSPKSKWDPRRAGWPGWCCLVIKTFSMNLHKKHKLRYGILGDYQDPEVWELVPGSLLPELRKDLDLAQASKSRALI